MEEMLLKPLQREHVAPELHHLWDACQEHFPAFSNLWATMANSPIVFKSIWGGLVEYRLSCASHGRLFELAIVLTSRLMSCSYCVDHHTARARNAGFSEEQLNVLAGVKLTAAPRWKDQDCFSSTENIVLALAYHLVWSGVYAQVHDIHPRVVYKERKLLHAALRDSFSSQQIEELVWRITQCAAFNWHNTFLEIQAEV